MRTVQIGGVLSSMIYQTDNTIHKEKTYTLDILDGKNNKNTYYNKNNNVCKNNKHDN